MSWFAVLAVAVIAAGILIHARIWPYTACRACSGRRGRGVGSTPRSWNRCWRCGGSGERLRLTARAWPRWRHEAKDR